MTEGSFEPARLRLARELFELSQVDLASRVGLSAAAIGQFEAGASRPSTNTVDALSGALKTPVAFFNQPITETHEGFFRSLRRTSIGHRRRARALAHLAHDIAATSERLCQAEAPVPRISVVDLHATRQQVEDVAADVRQTWKMPTGPVENVVSLLEQHGVLVIRMPLDTSDVDAFSLPFESQPVVVLGSDKADRARSRFDAAHELGHLVMHGNQIWGVKEVEQQANWFAAAFLMPAQDISAELPQRPDWAALFALKRRWQVSLGALLMRAKALGRMSDSQYLTAIKASSARGWRRVEPVPLGEPERTKHFGDVMRSAGGQKAAQLLPAEIASTLLQAASGCGQY